MGARGWEDGEKGGDGEEQLKRSILWYRYIEWNY